MNDSGSSRKVKAELTKKALYKSAITLFNEKGFDNVHIEEIAEKAGTSKGSFYTYFKSKDEVVIEHYQQIDKVYENSIEKLKETNIQPSLQLQSIFQEGLIFCDDLGYEFLSIVLINQLNVRDGEPFMASKNRKLYKIVKTIIEEGRISGDFTNEDTLEFQLDMALAFYRGIFLEYCLLRGSDCSLSEFGKEPIKKFTSSFFQ